jgi:hypothetical protein
MGPVEETDPLKNVSFDMMMLSLCVRSVILCACVFANPPADALKAGEKDAHMFVDPNALRVYDCAANSLYVLCRKMHIAVSYDKCLQLLPIACEGNSMLAVKQALASLGLRAEAQRISVDELADISGPAIVWISFEGQELAGSRLLGHYFVLWSTSEGVVQVLDYPKEPVVLPIDLWMQHLHSTRLRDLVVLLCQQPEMARERSVSSIPGTAGSKRRSRSSESGPSKPSATVVLRPGVEQPPLAYVDFGSVAEGSTLSQQFHCREPDR